mmetsp:Transcript_3489/g.4296  ORF Transcript_3489/g.4296 Transcript_3489/m.4296 type:complete len:89 (-) Transcript_3489:422-688(-)
MEIKMYVKSLCCRTKITASDIIIFFSSKMLFLLIFVSADFHRHLYNLDWAKSKYSPRHCVAGPTFPTERATWPQCSRRAPGPPVLQRG